MEVRLHASVEMSQKYYTCVVGLLGLPSFGLLGTTWSFWAAFARCTGLSFEAGPFAGCA